MRVFVFLGKYVKIKLSMRFLDKLLAHSDNEPKPKGYFWLIIVFLLAALGVSVAFFNRGNKYDLSALAGQPQQTKETERAPRIYSVSYKNGTFSPTNIRIRAGDTVRFENHSLFGIRVVSDDLVGFDSIGPVPAGGVFTYTFTARGIFIYFNEKEPEQVGKVIVR